MNKDKKIKIKSSIMYTKRETPKLNRSYEEDLAIDIENYQITSFERLVYDLNPNLPCMSKFLSNEYLISELDVVVDIENTLINKGSSYDKIMIDNHIIAFLASKINYGDTKFFINLNKSALMIPIILQFICCKC